MYRYTVYSFCNALQGEISLLFAREYFSAVVKTEEQNRERVVFRTKIRWGGMGLEGRGKGGKKS